jgi:cysteine desulfurase/selenocysteine lyase
MLCERKKAVLRHIPLRDDQTLDIEAFKGLLGEKTKLVSVAHVSNVLGIINPVEEIVRIAHSHGVPVCIDGAQSVPHMPVDVQALDCDFLAFSGHKMYGPTGIGVLYGKREWLEKLPPHEGGGEMINHVRWSGTTYNELPYKFEAGTPNFVGSYALHKAIEYMQSVGLETIEAHERELTEYCESRLNAIEGVHIYATDQPKAGVISFNVGTIHPFDIGTLLDQQGVAVRTGHHCAEPLIDELGVPGTVRVSFGLYNDKGDVDAFIAALKKAIMMLC